MYFTHMRMAWNMISAFYLLVGVILKVELLFRGVQKGE